MSEEAKKVQERLKQEQQLIVKTFSTESGIKLLDLLAQQYIWSPQLHKDPYQLYSRIAVQELITHFINTVEEATSNG